MIIPELWFSLDLCGAAASRTCSRVEFSAAALQSLFALSSGAANDSDGDPGRNF